MEAPHSIGPVHNYIVFEPDDPVQHHGTYLIPEHHADLDHIVSQLFDYFHREDIPVTMKIGGELSVIANADVLPYQMFKTIFLDKKNKPSNESSDIG